MSGHYQIGHAVPFRDKIATASITCRAVTVFSVWSLPNGHAVPFRDKKATASITCRAYAFITCRAVTISWKAEERFISILPLFPLFRSFKLL